MATLAPILVTALSPKSRHCTARINEAPAKKSLKLVLWETFPTKSFLRKCCVSPKSSSTSGLCFRESQWVRLRGSILPRRGPALWVAPPGERDQNSFQKRGWVQPQNKTKGKIIALPFSIISKPSMLRFPSGWGVLWCQECPRGDGWAEQAQAPQSPSRSTGHLPPPQAALGHIQG